MKYILFFLVFLAVSCGDKVYTPDHKGTIDDNTQRIEELEKRVGVLEVDLNSVESLLKTEVDKLEKADASNLQYLTDKLEDQANDLEEMIVNGDKKLSNKINMLRRQFKKHVRDNNSEFRDVYNQISELEDEFDAKFNELEKADKKLSERIKKSNKKRKQLAKEMDRFVVFQAQVDRAQNLLFKFGYQSLQSSINYQIKKVQKQISGVAYSVFHVYRMVNALERSLEALEDDFSDLEDIVGDIEVDLAALGEELEELEDDFSDLEEEVFNNSEDIEALADSLEEGDSCNMEYRNIKKFKKFTFGDLYIVCGDIDYLAKRNVSIEGGVR